jgi:hypothetical protein
MAPVRPGVAADVTLAGIVGETYGHRMNRERCQDFEWTIYDFSSSEPTGDRQHIFWPENDGWRGLCKSPSATVHGSSFEDAKKNIQLNYKCISKESCVNILREMRSELPEPQYPAAGETT